MTGQIEVRDIARERRDAEVHSAKRVQVRSHGNRVDESLAHQLAPRPRSGYAATFASTSDHPGSLARRLRRLPAGQLHGWQGNVAGVRGHGLARAPTLEDARRGTGNLEPERGKPRLADNIAITPWPLRTPLAVFVVRLRARDRLGELPRTQGPAACSHWSCPSTWCEAAALHKQDRQIRAEECLMASQNGGHITKQEQKTLNQQENAVSKQIGK